MGGPRDVVCRSAGSEGRQRCACGALGRLVGERGGGEPSRRDGVRPQEACGEAWGAEVSSVHVLKALSRELSCAVMPQCTTRGRAFARMSEGVSLQRHSAFADFFVFLTCFSPSRRCHKARLVLSAPPSD